MKKIFIYFLLIFVFIGCTRYAAVESKYDKQQDIYNKRKNQSAQVWLAGVQDSLNDKNLSETVRTNKAIVLANIFTEYAVDVVGKPPINARINVAKILDKDTKLNVNEAVLRSRIISDRRASDAKIQGLEAELAEQRLVVDERLKAFGAKFEQERNKQIWWNFTTWTTSTLVVAGIVAICFFCPAVIPIFLGILKWLFSKIVGLVNYCVPALANTVKGIANTKTVLRAEAEANKQLPPDKHIAYKPEEVVDLLNEELAKTQDQKDKDLINRIKTKVSIV